MGLKLFPNEEEMQALILYDYLKEQMNSKNVASIDDLYEFNQDELYANYKELVWCYLNGVENENS